MHRPHADDEEHERPNGEPELERQEDALSRALIGSASAKCVAAVEREPKRKHDEQRRRQWDEREPDGLPCTPKVAEAPEQAHAEEQGKADDEVADEPVDPARDESPDREENGVVIGVVENVRRCRRCEHGRDAGQPDHKKERLGARGDVVGVVLP